MHYVGGYEVSLLPRYQGEHSKDAVAENLFGQSALWNALHILLVGERRISVELRLAASAVTRSLSVYLLLLSPDPAFTDQNVVERVFRLLPKDYVWKQLGQPDLAAIIDPRDPSGKPWKIARVYRRSQYIDLPSLLQSAGGTGPGGPAPKSFLSLDQTTGDGLRYLPDDPNEFLTQIQSTRFCLPLLGAMEDSASDRRQLYEEMQVCAPVMISIALHPFSAAGLDEDRQVATRLRYFLDFLGGQLANSGFSQLADLRRVYDRYFLTNSYICVSTVRIAALDDSFALSVANQVCAWLGGTKAFEVFPPSPDKNFPSVAHVLADPDLELPVTEGARNWDLPLRRLRKTLAAERIAAMDDPRYHRFLIRLPHVYTLDEAAQLMRLPYGLDPGLPGLETRMLPPFFASSQRYDPILDGDALHRPPEPDRIRIGRVNPTSSVPATLSGDEKLHWHTVPVKDLCKHALIVGSTGSGKTVTTLFLVRELIRLQIPFLVIEPVKTEYYDHLRQIPRFQRDPAAFKRFRFEGTSDGKRAADYLVFDPMRLQNGVTVARHVSYLKSCFEAAFPMEAWQSLFLENGLLDYYVSDPAVGGCGFRLFTRGSSRTCRIEENGPSQKKAVYPSFETFSRYFLGEFLERELGRPDPNGGGRVSASSERMEEFRQVFRRRFDNLSKGPLGEAFRLADRHAIERGTIAPFSYLLKGPTVIELDAIPDPDQKALVMAFLMTFLYERRQADDLLARETGTHAPSQTKHVLIVEEAHRLLANPGGGRGGETVGMDSRAKAVSLFVDMLAEIRAFGQALAIVEQIPTKLVPEAVKNTNLKIMLRITSRDDRDYLGEAMSFNEDQKQFVSTLRAEPGKHVQFVAFDENVEQPVLLSLPLKAAAEGAPPWLFDEYFDPA